MHALLAGVADDGNKLKPALLAALDVPQGWRDVAVDDVPCGPLGTASRPLTGSSPNGP